MLGLLHAWLQAGWREARQEPVLPTPLEQERLHPGSHKTPGTGPIRPWLQPRGAWGGLTPAARGLLDGAWGRRWELSLALGGVQPGLARVRAPADAGVMRRRRAASGTAERSACHRARAQAGRAWQRAPAWGKAREGSWGLRGILHLHSLRWPPGVRGCPSTASAINLLIKPREITK